jgi:hypothetical protein
MTFAAITLCVASQRVFIVVSVYFVIDSVRKLLGTPSYDINYGGILSNKNVIFNLSKIYICTAGKMVSNNGMCVEVSCLNKRASPIFTCYTVPNLTGITYTQF